MPTNQFIFSNMQLHINNNDSRTEIRNLKQNNDSIISEKLINLIRIKTYFKNSFIFNFFQMKILCAQFVSTMGIILNLSNFNN